MVPNAFESFFRSIRCICPVADVKVECRDDSAFWPEQVVGLCNEHVMVKDVGLVSFVCGDATVAVENSSSLSQLF
jgi:hypothetical protein